MQYKKWEKDVSTTTQWRHPPTGLRHVWCAHCVYCTIFLSYLNWKQKSHWCEPTKVIRSNQSNPSLASLYEPTGLMMKWSSEKRDQGDERETDTIENNLSYFYPFINSHTFPLFEERRRCISRGHWGSSDEKRRRNKHLAVVEGGGFMDVVDLWRAAGIAASHDSCVIFWYWTYSNSILFYKDLIVRKLLEMSRHVLLIQFRILTSCEKMKSRTQWHPRVSLLDRSWHRQWYLFQR